jgi:hypothetical protein
MAILKNTTFSDSGHLTLPRGSTNSRPVINTTVAAFTTVGTTTWTAPTGVTSVEVLVVAGGGGGGTQHGGGGGGSGGLIYNPNYPVTPGSTYTITIGAGGTSGASSPTNGGNSVFDSLTAIGGGAGGNEAAPQNGSLGGSGGGGAGFATATSGGAGTAGQGNPGGRGAFRVDIGTTYGSGAGGGGAGQPGWDGAEGQDTFGAGGGGDGLYFGHVYGTNYGESGWFAGGGGGGYWGSSFSGVGMGGRGGGGNGGAGSTTNLAATAGTANTGGGGGGGRGDGSLGAAARAGAAGGSGIVLLKYSVTDGNEDPRGLIRFNTDLRSIEVYEGTSKGWVTDNPDKNFGGHNLIEHSHRVGTFWTKEAASDTLTFNNAVAPDGSTTATLFTGDGTTSTRHFLTRLLNDRQQPNKFYTFSCYVKPRGATQYLSLETASYARWENPGIAVFQLTGAGAVISTGNANITASIVEDKNGFYRCSITAQRNGATGSNGWYLNYTNSVTGAATNIIMPSSEGYWLWGCQSVEGKDIGILNQTYSTFSPVSDIGNGYNTHVFSNLGTATIVSAKIYHVVNVLRAANYTVQYSDDNVNWTNAFSGVMSASTVGIATGTVTSGGSGTTGNGNYGRHRYWRYVEGAAVTSHHPRSSRIMFVDDLGNEYLAMWYAADNPNDVGIFIIGTTGSYSIPGKTYFVPAVSGNVEVLVVAGGGAGGTNQDNGGTPGGGGGAGGVIYKQSYPVRAGEQHTVIIGSGAPQAVNVDNIPGGFGENSRFDNLIAIGGGGGGCDVNIGWGGDVPFRRFGMPGGSGGGASRETAGAAGVIGQGFPGGSKGELSFHGGGGGAGSAGGSGADAGTYHGGSGLLTTITGANLFVGAGGGGGGYSGVSAAPGGIGGGGAGATFTGANGAHAGAGVEGTGSGGGGSAAQAGASSWGGAGGSGIVVVRYKYD